MNYIITEETLLLQKRAGIITESQYQEKLKEEEVNVDADIEKGLKMAFAGIERDIESNKEKLTESAGLAIAGTALAIPELMKIVAKIAKSVSKFLGGSGKTSDKVIAVADKLHHFLIGLIEKALKVLGMKDTDVIHKTANIIFHVIIASLMIASGYAAVKAFKASNISSATLEGALAAVKNGEVQKFIGKELAKASIKIAPNVGAVAIDATALA